MNTRATLEHDVKILGRFLHRSIELSKHNPGDGPRWQLHVTDESGHVAVYPRGHRHTAEFKLYLEGLMDGAELHWRATTPLD